MARFERYTVYIRLKSYNLNPCTFPVFTAFTYAAAHQFFADANYPKAITYYVREKRLPIYEENDSQQMRLMED